MPDPAVTSAKERKIMLILGINWDGGFLLITTGYGQYNCPIQERDDDYYFKFKGQWHKVSEYAPAEMQAEIKRHRTGLLPKRQSISQSEFEAICWQVLAKHPSVTDAKFLGTGTLEVIYPSHSGKTRNGATLYFGEKGYITHEGWQYRAGSNEGIFIGEEISKRIQNALYD